MLPNEPGRSSPEEEAILLAVRRLLDQNRLTAALAMLSPLVENEETSTRSLRTAAALFARARDVVSAVRTFRTLARRYEESGNTRLAAGALHQAYAMSKTIDDAAERELLMIEVRTALADVLEQLGFRADARQVLGLPEEPREEPMEVEDDEVVEVVPLAHEQPDRPSSVQPVRVAVIQPVQVARPRVVETPRPLPPRVVEAPRSIPPPSTRRRAEPTHEDIEATIAEIDFFIDIDEVDEAHEIAQQFLARWPGEPTIQAIADGLSLTHALESNPPLRRQA